jgi:5,10-methylene-tetrahydrofolate dehydrogenase/methenyl tetrahydrofolate cyclohydrolase
MKPFYHKDTKRSGWQEWGPRSSARNEVRTSERGNFRQDPDGFTTWLQKQNIVLLGKGATGGGPILNYFKKQNIKLQLIDSKTKNPEELMQQADIIISAVGKQYVVKPHNLKPNVILLSVGIFRDENNKLSGDYDVELVKEVAAFYTPTPGGVGPVNVAKLMENLITATEKQTQN